MGQRRDPRHPGGFDGGRGLSGAQGRRVKDLGFAVTIQDATPPTSSICTSSLQQHAEFAQAVPHNSYYFHTDDNEIRDVQAVQGDP